MSHAAEILTALQEKIARSPQQRITFCEYMNWVLYDQTYGYYSVGKVEIGKQGDFFTAVSLGSDFGELLAEKFVQLWRSLDQPSNFSLVEMGAGQGLLARDILVYLQQVYPEFWANLDYVILERSPALRSRQQEILEPLQQQGIKICWADWESLEPITGCFFSNELLDAFPVHQVIVEQGQLREIYVTFTEQGLTEITGDLSTPKLETYFENLGINLLREDYPEGYRTEVNLSALDWLEQVTKKLKKGYLLTIDYGYPAHKYYHPQRYQGTLKCYFQHRHHNDPYINLGQQDLTAHVDFTTLEKYGSKLGLTTLELTQQALFLMSLGLGDRLGNLSQNTKNIMEIFQRRDALHPLMDPNGLGGFLVLLQANTNS